MTTAVKEKKPFLPQRKPQAPGGSVAVRAGAGAPVRTTAATLSIGGEPRVHLLPLDVQERKKLRVIKRRLLTAVIAVVAVVAIAYGGVTLDLTSAQGQLSAAQSTTSQLLVQQSKYGQVTKIKSDIAAIQGAQKDSTAQEVLWGPFIGVISRSLPSGADIQAVNAQIDSPFGAPAATTGTTTTTVPLQGPHIATVQLTIGIPQADIPGWLNTLPSLTGFVDAVPGSVTKPSDGSNLYVLSVTVHLNSDAISHRFTKAAGSN